VNKLSGIALLGLIAMSNAAYVKIWDKTFSNQGKGIGGAIGADTSTLKAGYFYTEASVASIAPASDAPLIASITASNAIGVNVTNWPAADGAPYPSASLGWDFYNNGALVKLRTGKKTFDLTAYQGFCITYNTNIANAYNTDKVWVKVMQSDFDDTWGTDYYTEITGAGTKAWMPFSAMAIPTWCDAACQTAKVKPKDFSKAVAVGFAAKGGGTFAMTEFGLGNSAADCASMTAAAAPTTIITTAAVSSSSAVKVSSSSVKASSSAAAAILNVASTADFGITNVGKNTVNFFVQSSRMVTLEAYDLLGNRVATLFNGVAQGNVTAQWNSSSMKQGVYMFRLSSGSDVRMIRGTVAH